MSENKIDRANVIRGILFILFLLGVVIGGPMYIIPKYRIWNKQMKGKALLMQAEQEKLILIEDAKARLEAEKLNAQAEIERARGMAEAMKIENGQLTEVYNQYLFIRSLKDLGEQGDLPQIIYVPSNGMVPVMDLKTGG